jgi:hypothetical protein
MTRHLCIPGHGSDRSHGQAIGLFVQMSSQCHHESRTANRSAHGESSSVTNLMQRTAPSNFTFKWPAGRSPLSGLKPLFSP